MSNNPLWVVVRVFELDSDEPIRQLRKNIAEKEWRDWLMRILLWATQNHKIVEVVRAVDDR